MNSNPIIVIGGGGHARVVIDTLLACGDDVLGFVDKDRKKTTVEGISRLGNDDYILASYDPDEIYLANGIGSVGIPGVRFDLFDRFKKEGFNFISLIHPSAVVSPSTHISEGVQVMAGAIIQPGVTIGENTIINTCASVDHDCRIGAHAHLAPGVTLSGNVSVGDFSHIGTGATVIQSIHIGAKSIVGAGSVVIRDVGEGLTVIGVPATKKT